MNIFNDLIIKQLYNNVTPSGFFGCVDIFFSIIITLLQGCGAIYNFCSIASQSQCQCITIMSPLQGFSADQ